MLNQKNINDLVSFRGCRKTIKGLYQSKIFYNKETATIDGIAVIRIMDYEGARCPRRRRRKKGGREKQLEENFAHGSGAK